MFLFALEMTFALSSGDRTNAVSCDMSAILPEDVEQEVKDAAEISMGTEISEEDLLNVGYLCDQVHERITIVTTSTLGL